MKITSYEFEVYAKNAVSKVLRNEFNINIPARELDFVWFAHELGFKKCTIYHRSMGTFYAEVTFNRDTDEIYVDIYKKTSHNIFHSNEFKREI